MEAPFDGLLANNALARKPQAAMGKVRGTPITINRGGTNKRDKKRDFLKSIKK